MYCWTTIEFTRILRDLGVVSFRSFVFAWFSHTCKLAKHLFCSNNKTALKATAVRHPALLIKVTVQRKFIFQMYSLKCGYHTFFHSAVGLWCLNIQAKINSNSILNLFIFIYPRWHTAFYLDRKLPNSRCTLDYVQPVNWFTLLLSSRPLSSVVQPYRAVLLMQSSRPQHSDQWLPGVTSTERCMLFHEVRKRARVEKNTETRARFQM